MPLPTVGTRALGTSKLTPKARGILKQRATGAARREYAPILAADQQAFGGVNRAFRNEKKSIVGATDIAQRSLSQAMKELARSGLSGRYLNQTRKELSARQGEVAQSIPFLLADAANERAEGIQEARSTLLGHQAEMQKSAATKFNSLLKEAQTSAASVAKERSEQRGNGEKFDWDPLKLKNAQIALARGLDAWSKNPIVTIEVDGEEVKMPAQEALPLKTKEEWRAFAGDLETSGSDAAHIMEVVRRALKKRQREVRGAAGTHALATGDQSGLSPMGRTAPIFRPFKAPTIER